MDDYVQPVPEVKLARGSVVLIGGTTYWVTEVSKTQWGGTGGAAVLTLGVVDADWPERPDLEGGEGASVRNLSRGWGPPG